MGRSPLDDYPDRYALSNELHARPFPELTAPCRAAFVAIKQPRNASERDRQLDRDHLIALLDRYGAPHPAPDASHYSARLGRGFLKWELHSEFVTYTIFADGVAEAPFDGSIHAMFPEDWLCEAPGKVLTSSLVRVELAETAEAAEALIDAEFSKWFVPESLALSWVIDGCAAVAGDFRIDEQGHVRFAVVALPGAGKRRLGRIVQRLLEIETYKSASMLTLPIARKVASQVAVLDRELSQVVKQMSSDSGNEAQALDQLLRIAAEIELLSTETAFRFGAAGAYEAIVNQRIEVLREERIGSRQLFAEFMMRRYDPAMRTCRSALARLRELSARASRASDLLRTRVDVASTSQNVEVLRRMDERAALQLRLQETVEGLSVVAISYYAVNLGANVLKPVGDGLGLSEPYVYAILTPLVVGTVWLMVRRLRKTIVTRDQTK